jgi:ABC-2 type transport system ATP-binding protein
VSAQAKEPIIVAKNLRKHFKVYKHHHGRFGGLRDLLTREYEWVRAVDGINFEVRQGELVGYIGPNGAGKSTTIKMLAGLLVPSAGELRVNGRTPWKERKAHVATIGTVFGQRTTLWWDLPVIESLQLLQHVYRVPQGRFQHNLDAFRTLLDLGPFMDTPVRSLSLGQRMRADLCAALLHDPVLLFLDEPTIGLDVVAKERIRDFIAHVNQERGTTVILTTHDLADVSKLCERIMIIDHGQLLYDGTLESLHDRFGGKRELVVDLAQPYNNLVVEDAQIKGREGLRVTYTFDRNAITASALIGRLSARYQIQDLQVREPQIEDTVRRIYEERLLEPGSGTS